MEVDYAELAVHLQLRLNEVEEKWTRKLEEQQNKYVVVP
jgi:hypothetical protein